MYTSTKKLRTKRAAVALGVTLALAACGGGGGGGAPEETEMGVTVIDGPIENATVCLDLNGSGTCDSGEPMATTNAAGKATLRVAPGDVGRFPVVAMVGTNARDADTGNLVTTAFSMSAPADRSAVVSPLTTLVHTAMQDTGLDSTQAEAIVRSQSGLEVSLFIDYTTGTDAASAAAGTLARLAVLVAQQQETALALAVGSQAIDGTTISPGLARRAVRRNMLQNLELLAAAAARSGGASAAGAARDSLLTPQVAPLVADSGLTVASLPTVVAIDNQQSTPAAVAPYVPTGGYSLASLDFTDASNHFMRFFTSSLVQDTPDANNNLKYQERRFLSTAGSVAAWASGNNPRDQAIQNWNGSAWVGCGLNFEHGSVVRDAQGRGRYTYCDNRETGTSQRATFDIAGRTMTDVYQQIRDAGYTNLTVRQVSALGSATFPADSKLQFQTSTVTSAAVAYYPGRSFAPNNGNSVWQAGTAAAAGGDARSTSDLACASTTTSTETTTLESMIAQAPGKPCIFNQQSFTYNGQTYRSDVPSIGWGNSVLSLGTIGTAAVGSGAAPGYYTSNTRLRVAFAGGGSTATTYYACKERFNDGSTRQCAEIGTGTYTIATLGDARVMSFNNLPARASELNFSRVFVERGGRIYYGFQNRLVASRSARLNTFGAAALLGQLGLPAPNPEQPLALTAGSYQGTWDMRDPSQPAGQGSGLTLFANNNGSTSCADTVGGSGSFICNLAITNPATGAFTLTIPGDGATVSGRFDMLTSTGSGSHDSPGETPSSGSVVIVRR